MCCWLAHAPAEKMQEVPNQVRNIISAFAERGDFDRKNIKSKEQIVSELSALCCEGQVLVRCGDDPDIHWDELITADTFDDPLLQNPQEHDLRFGRKLADLIQKDSS